MSADVERLVRRVLAELRERPLSWAVVDGVLAAVPASSSDDCAPARRE